MFKVWKNVMYRIGALRSGYYVVKFPSKDDPSILATKLKTREDAINVIKEDINNAENPSQR